MEPSGLQPVALDGSHIAGAVALSSEAGWNQVDDDKMDALTPTYHLQRVAAFPAMDDPERNLLILYRLDPATPSEPPRRHRKPVIPRLLQTSFGQQPSPTQLVH